MELERPSHRSLCRRDPGVIARRIAGETVLVPTRRRAREMALFTLNEVGTHVWERLDGETSFAALVDAVTEAFEVDRDHAEADVARFLAALGDAGCAQWLGEPRAEGSEP